MFFALGLAAATSGVAGESSSPALERSAISFHMKMPAGAPIRAQYLYQEILARLLLASTRQASGMKPCAWEVFQGSEFGVSTIQVDHPDAGQRMNCLRAGVHLLLQQTISESDFLSARKSEAEYVARWYEPYPGIFPFDGFGLVHAALRTVYQKNSPLHQIYSTRSNEVREVSYDEFALWLRQSRDNGLIDFAGERKLLEKLGLIAPDPMVLRLVPSLDSPRLAGGAHPFEEGERFRIPALILVRLYPDGLDQEISRRLSCNLIGPSQLGGGRTWDAIASTYCDIHKMLNNEVWAFFFVSKVASASYQDFCAQVQALTRDTDIATVVRFSPEGTRGLYLLLPARCDSQQ